MTIIVGAGLSTMALHTDPCLALFSVVVRLHHLDSQNDPMRYDAVQDSC